jgi:transposase
LTLAYLDECGFSPSQPVSYSWTLKGQRKLVPYENPKGRRANAISVYLPFGNQANLRRAEGKGQVEPELWWDVVPRTLRAQDVLRVLEEIPRGPGALVVVLDNASVHVNRVVKAELPRLRKQGIHLYHLPPYSPELNQIEPLFGVVKYTEMPERTFQTTDDLIKAIRQAFHRSEQRLIRKTQHHPLLGA